MGTRGTEIVDLDVNELIKKLNNALADEWLAYYQYWVASKIVEGPLRGVAEREFAEHADEELKHANMLVERILQLGGTPLLKPEDWDKATNCGYDEPSNPAVKRLLEQNIKAEQCAIDVYKELIEMTRGKDDVTYYMVFEILQDEVEHEDELQQIEDDLKHVKSQ
jgi:bacterioferritin